MSSVVPDHVATSMFAKANKTTDPETAYLWHQRLGHQNFDNLNRLVRHNHVKGITLSPTSFYQASKCPCQVCIMSKHNRAPFQKDLPKPTEPMVMVGSDTCGPYPVESLGGGKYVLTLVDYYSTFTETSVCKSKKELPNELKRMILAWETRTKKKRYNMCLPTGVVSLLKQALNIGSMRKGLFIISQFQEPLNRMV
jgi:hypothetical protein